MTYKDNVRAVLECNFAGFKDDIIDCAVEIIASLSQSPIPHDATNGDAFHKVFGIYATELWSMSEKEFLDWWNTPYRGKDEDK